MGTDRGTRSTEQGARSKEQGAKSKEQGGYSQSTVVENVKTPVKTDYRLVPPRTPK